MDNLPWRKVDTQPHGSYHDVEKSSEYVSKSKFFTMQKNMQNQTSAVDGNRVHFLKLAERLKYTAPLAHAYSRNNHKLKNENTAANYWRRIQP